MQTHNVFHLACCSSTDNNIYPFLQTPKMAPEPKNLKPEEVLWFVRKFPCSANDINIWKEEVDKKIKAEWKDRIKMKEKCKDKNLWIPLNGK